MEYPLYEQKGQKSGKVPIARLTGIAPAYNISIPVYPYPYTKQEARNGI